MAIDFNNPIDANCLSAGRVSVSPAVGSFHSTVVGNQIIVVGEFRSGVDYKVVLDGRIADKFGQALGNEYVVKLRGVVTQSNVMGTDFISLAPEGPLQYRVHSAGKGRLKLNIWKVSPNYWTPFNLLYRHGLVGPIGILCGSKILTSDGSGVDTTIDLKPYIASKYGHYVIEEQWIDKATSKGRSAKGISPATQYRWVQITDLAMDAFGSGRLQTFVSHLSDGKPLEGVDIFVCDTEIKTLSDKHGFASIELPPVYISARRLAWTLVAQKGDDSCLITIPAMFHGVSMYRWYAVSDRNLYKPGETVKIKGWLRAIGSSGSGSGPLTLPQLKSISYKLLTANYILLLEGQASVDSMGGFAFDVPLPTDLDLGSCMVMLQPPSADSDEFRFETHDVRIRIDDFRRPEFEVNLASESKNPVLLGEQCKPFWGLDTSMAADSLTHPLSGKCGLVLVLFTTGLGWL
ncbi:MAG: hypothetical protein IPO31_10440 [Candidatus Obscuribacter sp.]|nr:hypothetical protein [Candidatus Obscuribacter sp.]